MNIHKRFAIHFFMQLILVFTIFFCILVTLWAIIGFLMMNDELSRDLSKADSSFFKGMITIQKDNVVFDDELKELAKKQKGWLLLLTPDGKVIGSYNAPQNIPARFSQNELATLLLHNQDTTVEYTYWKLEEMDTRAKWLLFGRNNDERKILNEVKATVDWENQQLHLSPATCQWLDHHRFWVQFISSTGKVVDSYGNSKMKKTYSFQDLIDLANNNDDSINLYYHEETNQAIILGSNDSSPVFNGNENQKSILHIFLTVIVVLILLLILGTFWYASKFGAPLITIMKWIGNLGKGMYEQPLDLHRRPIMLNKKGKLKRSYRLYKDLIGTLSQLTETLKENELQRQKGIQTREEWISGLSHDLKTPLSSIAGYAQMLKSENYSWSEKETREFGKIIAEKSTYMMELLEDLTLTYRLKNNGLPITKETVDINEFIRRTLIHFINDPANKEKNFIFHPYEGTLLASVDPKWFQRVLDNLIANAIKYNPAGTTIKVSLSPIEQHLIVITIEDDGIGMDKETLGKLFQRYYRGTNTKESGSGTGLGMAITKQLIQLHGGSINVKSEPDNGTTVRIMLPV